MPKTSSCCQASLAVLRKLGIVAPFALHKQLDECLILFKLDYCDTVFHPLPDYQTKRFHRVQCWTASFVTRMFCNQESVINLVSMPMKEKREWHLVTTAFKARYNNQWPSYLKLHQYHPRRPGLLSTTKNPIDESSVQNTFT